MSRISYLNGEFLAHEKCLIHIEDRSCQFGDGVYEVILFVNNKLIDFDGHFQRLSRSLKETQIEFDILAQDLQDILSELFAKNNLESGSCYIQISRGVAPRIQCFPEDSKATFNITVSPPKIFSRNQFRQGISVMTHEDIRWSRCDIKSLNLLAPSMLNQKAKDSGFDDVIMLRDGYISEGSFSNVFMVDENNNLITREADNYILCGITRNRIIDLALQENIKVVQRKFSVEELLKAKEVFLTSSTLIIRPVTKIDDVIISNAKVGNIAQRLFDKYQEFIGQ